MLCNSRIIWTRLAIRINKHAMYAADQDDQTIRRRCHYPRSAWSSMMRYRRTVSQVHFKVTEFEVLNLIDISPIYVKRTIRPTCSAELMKDQAETKWTYRHGSRYHFITDPEFCEPFVSLFLYIHNRVLKPRSSWLSHEIGKITIENGISKPSTSQIRIETTASPTNLVAWAPFILNVLHCILSLRILN